MEYNVYFFDLDSTLLRMDQDKFIESYFKAIYVHAMKNGLDAPKFMKLFERAVYTMVKNDGKMTNSELFWSFFETDYDVKSLNEIFEKFYETEFDKLSVLTEKSDLSSKIIKKLKSQGKTIILATSPLFPPIATEKRMKWAGLDREDFLDVTTYDNCHYCKPSHKYYEEIIERNNLKEEAYIMIGNDVDDDFSDIPSNFEKIIITDHLLNRENKNIEELNIKAMTLEEYYNSL